MARDNREVLSAVRLETQTTDGPNVTTTAKTYGVDDKDELAAVLTPEQGQRLVDSGALSGDWTFGKASGEVKAAPAPAPPPPVVTQTPEAPAKGK